MASSFSIWGQKHEAHLFVCNALMGPLDLALLACQLDGRWVISPQNVIHGLNQGAFVDLFPVQNSKKKMAERPSGVALVLRSTGSLL